MMVVTRNTTFIIILFSILIFCQMTGGTYAQEEPGLEEILEGFEDNQKSDDNPQELIEGFDDGAKSEKETGELGEEEPKLTERAPDGGAPSTAPSPSTEVCTSPSDASRA